jgi:ubiquitin-conjugating enzyme E2 variant
LSGGLASRRGWLVALDYGSLTLAASLTGVTLSRIEALPPLAWAPVLVLAAALGWAFADLGSGLVHFLCDRFGSERTPLLGPAVIRPFREHHLDPGAITTHGFAELSGNSALALSPILALGSELAPQVGVTLLHSAAFSWLMSASAGLFATNQIHRWAHLPRAPRLARWLQSARLAIRAEDHARHHSAAHDRSFCITTGWCNAPLDRLGAWARIECRLRRSPGVAPRDRRPPPLAGAPPAAGNA